MNLIKRIFTLVAAGLICSFSYGQTLQKIHKGDGSILQLPLSGIDSINFSISSPAGKPISGALVRAGSLTVTSDTNGYFISPQLRYWKGWAI